MKVVIAIAVSWTLLSSTVGAQEAEHCAALVRRNVQIVREDLAGYAVLNATSPFSAPTVDGELQAILCGRESIHFALNDYHVLTDVHVPLYISDGARVAVLEISSGQLRVRFANGQMNESEGQALQQSINEMQSALQGEPHD